jgi:predicted DCC family thiol-disulfide oxidoreductase YuxK
LYPVILFDGVCNLCNGSVQWVLLRDKRSVFHFAALQSETGARILQKFGLPADALNTVVLAFEDRIYTESDAVIEVARRLGGVWRLLTIFKIVPRPLRNAVYRFVGRNRYRWFGKSESCLLPRPEWRARFVS